tara:strand:+ start:2701 stop:2979 length:279 start_codon:yes stop_codon:yes gene_type:complete
VSDSKTPKPPSNAPPKTNSTEWKKNEKTIATNPVLRQLRDIQQGFKPSSGITTGGDVSPEYKSNYDKIVWTKREEDEKPQFRTKVNGKYTDE